MAAATIVISETNGSGETVTSNISSVNFGSADSVNLTASAYPITPGNNSFEKYIRLQISAMGDATQIDNIQVYAPSASFPVGTGTFLKSNLVTSGYSAATYAAPVATTSTVATTNSSTTVPGSANIGIASSLTGALTSAGYSDYIVLQIQTHASDTAGTTITLRFQWDEVA